MKIFKNLFRKNEIELESKAEEQEKENVQAANVSSPWVIDLSTQNTISRLKNINLEINSVIDIGASDGRWSADLMPYYPEAEYLLVEANPYHYPALDKFVINNPKAKYYKGAAAEKKDTICFQSADPFGGLAYDDEVSGDGIIKVPANSVDNLVKEYNLSKGHLLKLDTHGFEVPIFEGAKEALKNTNLIIVETYSFKLNESALKFYEICQYLDKLGFSMVDFSEPLWREKDGMFWQFDMFFIPSNHPNLQYNHYR